MAFKGIGKFTASFIPIEALGLSATSLPWGMTPADFCAIIIMSVTGVYCVAGGMYSVVMNDLIQFALIVIAAVIIGVVAIVRTTPRADRGRRARRTGTRCSSAGNSTSTGRP